MDNALWTECVCGDGAVLLRDGVPVSISDILAILNVAEAALNTISRLDYSLPDPFAPVPVEHTLATAAATIKDALVFAEVEAAENTREDPNCFGTGYDIGYRDALRWALKIVEDKS